MSEVGHYREWLINCSNDIVPDIEPAIMERDPWGDVSAMDRYYYSLPLGEQAKFVEAMREMLADDNISMQAKMMIIDFARPRAIWDIGEEVERLDRELPREPWDYHHLNHPEDETELDRIDLRGAVNKFLIVRAKYQPQQYR